MMKLHLHYSRSELKAAHIFIVVNVFSKPPPYCSSLASGTTESGSQVMGPEDTEVVIWELPNADLCDTHITCFLVIFVSYLGRLSVQSHAQRYGYQ